MPELNYKTFDQMMASIEEDLKLYADNNLINRRNYIKTARKINKELGPKINNKKEMILNVQNFKASLPLDLITVLCIVGTRIETLGKLSPAIHGTRLITNKTEELVAKGLTPIPAIAKLSCDGTCTYITRVTESTEIKYDSFFTIFPTKASLDFFHKNSPNRAWCDSSYTLSLNESEVMFNFECGEIYISYVSDMEDGEGNLLVLDHELVNDYYEFAIKEKILHDLWINGEETYDKYKDINQVHLPKARQEAHRLVYTPEYKTIKEYDTRMLQKYYNEFYKMFT